MTATVKSSTLQVIEGQAVGATLVTNQVGAVPSMVEATVTAQMVQGPSPLAVASSVSKQLILGAPAVTNVKSSTLQVLEASQTTPTATLVTNQIAATQTGVEASVTAQIVQAPVPGSAAQGVSKQLILGSTLFVTASELSVEVIGDSSITPPVPGQRVVRFFS